MSVAPTPDDNVTGKDVLVIDFAGEIYRVEPTQTFTVGREGDLALSDNPFLHRKFLVFEFQNGLWWVHNQGSRLGATVADMAGASRAWVTPGVRVPMVFGQMAVVFSAGSTTYEILAEVPCPSYENRDPEEAEAAEADSDAGQATMGMVVLTESQKLLILSLAEPWLRRAGTGTVSLPRNVDAAARLGWGITRFNRKLDHVCDRLTRYGVRGLHGGPEKLAVNRRARLVEHAVATRLVTPDMLYRLEDPAAYDDAN